MTGWFADTLAKRLFGLMCIALVGSHLVAFAVVRTLHAEPGGGARGTSSFDELPTFPSLPPTPGVPQVRGGAAGPPPPRAATPRPAGPPAPPPGHAAMPAPPDGAGAGGFGGDPAGGPRGDPHGGPREPDRAPPAGGAAAPPDGAPPGGGPALPLDALLLDYGVRFAVIAVAAWFGSRWLALPMQRLVQASRSLGGAVSGAAPAVLLDERRGTREVRETARVFNEMASELRQQFRSRGLMVAAISHDLRTPLTRLRMRLQNDGRMAAEPRQRSVDDICEMSALIDNVLEVFRLDGGGTTGGDPAQPLDVDALLQAMVDDLAEQGQHVSYHGSPAVAVAQPAALRRVVDNLIANALRYGERVEVRLRVADGVVRLTVDDVGPGIPVAELQAVFEPFYRVEASRNRHTGGSGLGLYIARELTRRQRGGLALANRPEGGLRAELTLPLHGPDARRGELPA